MVILVKFKLLFYENYLPSTKKYVNKRGRRGGSALAPSVHTTITLHLRMRERERERDWGSFLDEI